MQFRLYIMMLCSALTISIWLSFSTLDVWGFFGHRLINRMAIFTLPTELFGFYKSHLVYVQNHAVDPDKRRYATKLEGPRHYIDLDHWTDLNPEILTMDLVDVLLLTGRWHSDTTLIYDGLLEQDLLFKESNVYKEVHAIIKEQYNMYEWMSERELIITIGESQIKLEDQFSSHGIVPYHIVSQQRDLEYAFIDRDVDQVLRLSAEIGHYFADAHVPLHTTENYNGQLSGQDGIHAFWETRIPELFAEESYDFFVDQATYIPDIDSFAWQTVYESHQLVQSLLEIENQIRQDYPSDQQYCYDNRGERAIRVPCKEYAHEYQERMKGMVEDRMRKAIWAVGSIYYTSWVNAGFPNLIGELTDSEENEAIIPSDYDHQMRSGGN